MKRKPDALLALIFLVGAGILVSNLTAADHDPYQTAASSQIIVR